MKGFDLEALREVLRDPSLHIMLALVQKVAVAEDRSICRVLVSVLPEKRPLIATMSWDAVGDEAGLFMLPEANDLVLIGQSEGDKDQAFIIRRLTSVDEKIPLTATDGSFVMRSRAGNKVWITSDTRINLSKGDTSPTENLVLGQMLKTFLSTFCAKYSGHKHIGNLGYYTAVPDNAADVTALKNDPVDNEGILSDIAFTEKGS